MKYNREFAFGFALNIRITRIGFNPLCAAVAPETTFVERIEAANGQHLVMKIRYLYSTAIRNSARLLHTSPAGIIFGVF